VRLLHSCRTGVAFFLSSDDLQGLWRGHGSTNVTDMPHVTIKTGIVGPDGQEEILTEYLCDWPGCPGVAVQVLGVVRGMNACAVVCAEHAAIIDARARNNTARQAARYRLARGALRRRRSSRRHVVSRESSTVAAPQRDLNCSKS
jgi:hypothetical protein